MNTILETERTPEDWRESTLVLIYKGKGNIQDCGNYRGIKLMSHTMKIWERIMKVRLRRIVEISEEHFGIMPGRSTTDAIFALRQLLEKHHEGQKKLHCVFIDLKKAYNRVPRKEVWNCMRMKGVPEKFIRIAQNVHQGSALSPFLFAMVLDCLTEDVRSEAPWTMMFADDVVICVERQEEVEERLERWRRALEDRGMRISRKKTEYLCVGEREEDDEGELKIAG